MGKCRSLHHASERISQLRENSRCEEFPERRGSALVRNRVKPLAVIGHEGAEGRLAKRMCLLEHRLKHRGEVAGRGIDDLKTSAVAVCCSNASRVSLMSRAFSIAMT